MNRVLFAEAAVLAVLQTIRIVLLVFKGVVVSLLAFGACQGDFYAHFRVPPVKYKRRLRREIS